MATNFLTRWSKRKLEENPEAELACESVASNANSDTDQQTPAASESEQSELQTAAISAHTDDASVAALLVSEVDSSVKKAALRKLFLSGEFSEVDRLNDYDHDYQSVKSLSSEVAGKLRDWLHSDSEEEIQQADLERNDDLMLDQDERTASEEKEIDLDNAQQSSDASEEVGQNIPHKQ